MCPNIGVSYFRALIAIYKTNQLNLYVCENIQM